MIILIIILSLLFNPIAWASGWYSTLQGTASDVQQDIPSDGVILQWSSFYQKWLFAYGVAPSGGTTGQVLTKNSGSNYDYSWTTPSGGGSSIVRGTFTNSTLSSGILTITHSWGLSAPYTVSVTISDNNGNLIFGAPTTFSTNSVAIDLTLEGTLSGTWGYIVEG